MKLSKSQSCVLHELAKGPRGFVRDLDRTIAVLVRNGWIEEANRETLRIGGRVLCFGQTWQITDAGRAILPPTPPTATRDGG